jgi:hypothetical protein
MRVVVVHDYSHMKDGGSGGWIMGRKGEMSQSNTISKNRKYMKIGL